MSEPKGAQGPTMEEILASIRKLIPEEDDAPAPRGASEAPELVLTQMLAEDGSLVRLATPQPVSPAVPARRGPTPPEPAPVKPPPTEPVQAPPAQRGEGETLETFVRRALEPQIHAWLEAHLPAMVERMVREVIDGIRRKSEEDER